MKRAAIAGAFALLLSAAGTAAAAETTSGSSAALQAKLEFDAGNRAFSEGRYEEALTAFQRADQLVPNPSVRFNMAVCLERLGRYDAAAQQYELVAEAAAANSAARERAAGALRELDARIGRLEVQLRGQALGIAIDDVRCAVPCVRRLAPGQHRIVALTARGEIARRIELAAGQRLRLELDLPSPAPKRVPDERRGSVESGSLFGPVGYAGAALGVAGAIGFTYFGLRANSLHERYLAEPTLATRDDGLQAQALANVSLATALLGVALAAVDAALLR
jgi:tetratricopeptide (TPR) repeat protein